MSKDNKHTDFLVIDIEATCYDKGMAPEGFISEIIEIGYAVYDATNKEIHSNGSIFIKPQFSVVSPFCTSLTGITQEMVDKGIPFCDACDILKKDLNSLSRPWCSVGDYDRSMFEEECKRLGIQYPFTKQHLNIKQQAAAILGKTKGLGGILTSLGLQFEGGRRHSGKADAYNAARILKHFANKYEEVLNVKFS